MMRLVPPFDCLCRAALLPAAKQLEMERLRNQTNPLVLRREIETLRDRLFALPGLPDGVVEDARPSLFAPRALASEPGP